MSQRQLKTGYCDSQLQTFLNVVAIANAASEHRKTDVNKNAVIQARLDSSVRIWLTSYRMRKS